MEGIEAEKGCLRHLLSLKLEGEAGFVLLQGTHSVGKQEAKGPSHPHGQLVPSDSCSPFPVSYTENGSHPHPGHLETKPTDHFPQSLCTGTETGLLLEKRK